MPNKKKKLLQISDDPNNKNWINDKNGFGYKMLLQMGWKEGKGLGLHENGIIDNISTKKIIEKRGNF